MLLVCFSQFHLPGKNSKGFCIKCPNHDSFRYKGAVVPVVMSGILTASQRVNPDAPRRKVVLAAGIRNLILSVSTSGFVAIRGFPEFFFLCSKYAQHEKPKWLERQTPFRNGEQQQTPGVFVTVCSCLCSVLPPTKVSTHQRHRMFLLSSRVFSFSPSHLSTFMKQSMIHLHSAVKLDGLIVTVLQPITEDRIRSDSEDKSTVKLLKNILFALVNSGCLFSQRSPPELASSTSCLLVDTNH